MQHLLGATSRLQLSTKRYTNHRLTLMGKRHSYKLISQRKRHYARLSEPKGDSTQTSKDTLNTYSSNKTTSMWDNLKRLGLLVKPQIKLIGISMGLLGISSAVSLIFPSAMGKIVDVILSPEGSTQLIHVVQLMAAASFAGGFSVILRSYFMEKASQRIVADLRVALYSKLLSQDLSFYDSRKTGELINRLANDTEEMSYLLVNELAQGLRRIVEGIGGLILLFYISVNLTLSMLLVLPPVFLGAVSFGRKIKHLSRSVTDAFADTTAKAEERLGSIRTVKVFVREKMEAMNYSKLVNSVYDLSVKVGVYSGLFYGVTYIAVNFAMLTVLYRGGQEILAGTMTPGDLTSFLFYSLYVAFAFSGISNFWARLMKALGSSERVFELLDSEYHIQGSKMMDEVNGEIIFDDVSFHYPSRPEENILRNFSLKLEPGKSLAIVGYSGSGKSTVTSLVGRFYDPTEGKIFIDGHDISEIDPKSLRTHIGYVPQDISLFSGSIYDNIAYGNPNATEEDVKNAAKEANASEFIEKFKDGFHTQVGDKGTQLSGGQKQRIGIARALLKNPQILILDEATSSLDVESEYLIQTALERLMKGRTVILIAHRLSTIRNADTIAVLNEGRLVEKGTYDTLLEKENGIVKQLVQKQWMNMN
eukprot:TRINITY_DN2713_c0_g1_i1.p1 TRINITY_DN2713_c0_g1~~TRINITY_DN2713_c0_g1_i1.p1  ORF type:complete len:647 (-),score=120.49 TRINITY_DN2713_c0_g1_i1:43-1983(-)